MRHALSDCLQPAPGGMHSLVWSERRKFDSVDGFAKVGCAIYVDPLLREGLMDLNVGKDRKTALVRLAGVLRLRKGSRLRGTVRVADADAVLVVLAEVAS